MQLARVVGTLVASIKSPGLEGARLLIVQPLDRHQEPVGTALVAADAVQMAGPGELVYVVAAREASLAMPEPFVPVDLAIVGIADAVTSDSATPAPAKGRAAKGRVAKDRTTKGPAAKRRAAR